MIVYDTVQKDSKGEPSALCTFWNYNSNKMEFVWITIRLLRKVAAT